MDPLVYVAMSGAGRALRAQQVHANNLANLGTAGFRADLELSTAQAPRGAGYDARHQSRLQADALSLRDGAVTTTGRDLDVAVSGGLLALQAGDGEVYTRAGALTVDAQGALTAGGLPVLGEGGPIQLPPFSRVAIGSDGTVSVQANGEAAMRQVARLRLVRADAAELTKNATGRIVTRSGEPLEADPSVTVRSGALEASNVSAVEEMLATMNLTRGFDLQMRLLKSADAMAEAGNRLMRE